jgi:hypothetical protein
MSGIETLDSYDMDGNKLLSHNNGGLQEWAEHSAENLALSEEACIFITHYAPDASHCDEECPVLIVLGPDTIPCVKLSCFVDGIECASDLVAHNVLRVIIPKHDSGVVPLWLIGKDELGTVLSHSESVPFYFLPTSSTQGILNFAHALSADYFTSEVFFKFRHTTRQLDLTGNGLTNLDFLRNFTELREVCLDHNQISHWVSFPHLPKLSSLSINHNNILQIDMFVNQLIEAGLANKLKYLSVLANPANPSFDRLEHRYYNFRIYIISKLPKLKLLDSRDVTDAERRHSQAIAEEESASSSPSAAAVSSHHLLSTIHGQNQSNYLSLLGAGSSASTDRFSSTSSPSSSSSALASVVAQQHSTTTSTNLDHFVSMSSASPEPSLSSPSATNHAGYDFLASSSEGQIISMGRSPSGGSLL